MKNITNLLTACNHELLLKLMILLFIIHLSLFNINCYSQVGINATGNPPNKSAMLDASSSNQGVLINRMTTAQRDAISSPAESLMIFNTTTNCFESFVNGSWSSLACPTPCSPPAPVAGDATYKCSTMFNTNWSASAGASSYYIDVSTNNGFANFVTGFNNLNVGNVTSFTVTGLTANTSYYYRVRAAVYPCITSSSNTISASTNSLSCPLPCQYPTFTVTHTKGLIAPKSVTITYNQTLSSLTGTSECWITQNLGASQQATSQDDTSKVSRGWYWQFNRKQGYEAYIRNNSASQTVRTPNSWNSIPDNLSTDWTSANDPCTQLLGQGWRIPAFSEWSTANSNGGWSYVNDAYNSALKIDGSGYLDPNTGWLYNLFHEDNLPYESSGYYWGSKGDTGNTSLGRTWFFAQIPDCCNRESQPHTTKAQGTAVRCVNP
jgi:hypothetical protein